MASIYISLGSNINRRYHVIQGLNALEQHYGTLILSSLFESDAVGFEGKPFYNMVIAIETSDSVDQVAKTLRDIEYANGREANAKKFSPRTLDLDLLLYDQLICEQPAQLPRDEITKNAFVLWPLAEVAPDVLHPVNHLSFAELWQDFDKTKQQLKKVTLDWVASTEYK